jgi:hypothetical protein
VKELIPEMFCCPEALLNTNALPLGELQEGGVVSDVILPPWAHNSAYEFVRINREALETCTSGLTSSLDANKWVRPHWLPTTSSTI